MPRQAMWLFSHRASDYFRRGQQGHGEDSNNRIVKFMALLNRRLFQVAFAWQ
jgi:hypothetical protein